jgi:hypothetical protein
VIPELAGHVCGTAADSQPLQRRRDGATDLVRGGRPGWLQGRQEQGAGPDRLKRAWRLTFGKLCLRSQDLRHRLCLASFRLRGLLTFAPHISSFTPASAYVFKVSAQPGYRPAGMADSGQQGSQGDADGEPRWAAALDQPRDLMPVEVVGVDLGQRPGDAEPREP